MVKCIVFPRLFCICLYTKQKQRVCKAWQKGPLFAEYRIQGLALIKYHLCQCSSVLTNGPQSLWNPPSNSNTNWILNIREDGGQAALLSNLHRIKWQTGCLYLCTLLFPSCPSFCSSSSSSSLPPSARPSCFDAVWQQLPLGEAPPPTAGPAKKKNPNKPEASRSSDPSLCPFALSPSPSLFPFSLLWFTF